MPQKNVEVELIPWLHTIYSLFHSDVINYIKILPKNSYLALEPSQEHQILQSKLMDVLIGKEPSRAYGSWREQMEIRSLRSSPKKISDIYWAVIEAMHEARKRNINVIPIGTLAAEEMRLMAGRGDAPRSKKRITSEFASDLLREKSFAKQVQTILKNFKGTKLPVLIGMYHASNIKRELEKLGIRAGINTALFGCRKRKVEKILKRIEWELAALQAGKTTKASLIYFLTQNYTLEKRRKENPAEVKERIIRELRAKEEKVKIPKKARRMLAKMRRRI